MAYQSFIPTRDADLLVWGNNFSAQVTALNTQVGITATQATDFAALNTAWVNAYTVATNSMTRSPGNIILKDEARAAMVAMARQLAGVAQKHPGTTDAQRADLKINVPKQRAPIPVPSMAPEIDILSVNGTTVKIRLHNDTLGRRGLPDGVNGVAVFSAVSETQPPMDPSVWNFEGNTGKTEFDIVFPGTLVPGTKVWITAFWFNPRKEAGPGTLPVQATLNYASSINAAQMKLAA